MRKKIERTRQTTKDYIIIRVHWLGWKLGVRGKNFESMRIQGRQTQLGKKSTFS